MKKIFISVITLFMFLILPGCNSSKTNPTPTQDISDTINKINGQTTDSFNDLSTFINDLSSQISNNKDDDLETFFSYKKELTQIDLRLDLFENEIEDLYRNQIISKNEYKQLERELDTLEDQLDGMEDKLESMFGIDDE